PKAKAVSGLEVSCRQASTQTVSAAEIPGDAMNGMVAAARASTTRNTRCAIGRRDGCSMGQYPLAKVFEQRLRRCTTSFMVMVMPSSRRRRRFVAAERARVRQYPSASKPAHPPARWLAEVLRVSASLFHEAGLDRYNTLERREVTPCPTAFCSASVFSAILSSVLSSPSSVL